MNAKRCSGFTMIEIIIAMAVAIILLVSVHSTVQAMTITAKRIQETHVEQARKQRFLEIIRRDLQGWYEKSETAQPAANSSAEQVPPFLRFTTTTDGLATGESSSSTRACEIQYTLRRSPNSTDVIRKESSNTAGAEVVVWTTQHVFNVEFEKKGEWIAEWSAKERPTCTRFLFGTQYIVIVP